MGLSDARYSLNVTACFRANDGSSKRIVAALIIDKILQSMSQSLAMSRTLAGINVLQGIRFSIRKPEAYISA